MDLVQVTGITILAIGLVLHLIAMSMSDWPVPRSPSRNLGLSHDTRIVVRAVETLTICGALLTGFALILGLLFAVTPSSQIVNKRFLGILAGMMGILAGILIGCAILVFCFHLLEFSTRINLGPYFYICFAGACFILVGGILDLVGTYKALSAQRHLQEEILSVSTPNVDMVFSTHSGRVIVTIK